MRLLQPPLLLVLLLAGMNILWSASYAIAKYGLGSLDPLSFIFWRFLIAEAAFLTWFAISRPSLKVRRADLLRIAAAGLLLGASNWLWVEGLALSQATDAALLFVFEPIWGIVLASIFLKEKLLPSTLVGLILVFLGLLALSEFDLRAFGLSNGRAGWGNLLFVAGLFCEGSFSVVLQPLVRRVAPEIMMAGTTLVLLAVIGVPIAVRGSLLLPAEQGAWLSLGYLGLVCTVAGYTLWVKAMQRVPLVVMLFTIFIQPLAGPLVAAVGLGEKIDGRVIDGGALLLSGMAVAVVGHLRFRRRETTIVSCGDLSASA